MTLQDVLLAWLIARTHYEGISEQSRNVLAMAAALKHVADHLTDLGHTEAALKIRAIIKDEP